MRLNKTCKVSSRICQAVTLRLFCFFYCLEVRHLGYTLPLPYILLSFGIEIVTSFILLVPGKIVSHTPVTRLWKDPS